jgi:hypothetical protein
MGLGLGKVLRPGKRTGPAPMVVVLFIPYLTRQLNMGRYDRRTCYLEMESCVSTLGMPASHCLRHAC